MNIEVESEFDAAGVTGKALVRYDVRITCTPTRATLEYPGDPLELFARQRREGWTVWGNEV